MAEDTEVVCGKSPLFTKWDQGKWAKDNTCTVKAKPMSFQFDGGIEHKDGVSFAIAKNLLPPLNIFDIKVVAKGMTGVTIDLGFISCATECNEKPCVNLTQIVGGLDVAGDCLCTSICGFHHLNGDTCSPECCPGLPSTSCCPPDETVKCGGMSNLIMTLHGTPPACSTLDLVFVYIG